MAQNGVTESQPVVEGEESEKKVRQVGLAGASVTRGTFGIAPEGEGCGRCGGFVFEAEKMMSRGNIWHKCCFKCKECKRSLDSMLLCEGPDKDIYCKTCYGKKYGPKGYGYGKGGGILQCDEIRGDSPYVKPHGDPKAKNPVREGGEGCPRCKGAVYMAEQVFSKGRAWHRYCFKCKACTKQLDSVLATDGPDGDVYCRGCYAKRYGPKGYGFAVGHGFLWCDVVKDETIGGASAADRFLNPDTRAVMPKEGQQGCPRCGGMVFDAEKVMAAKGIMWHRKCYKCKDCKRPLDSIVGNDGPDGDVYCKGCYANKYGPKGFGYGQSLVSRETHSSHYPEGSDPLMINPHFNRLDTEARPQGTGDKNSDGCGRCGLKVYDAEKLISKSRVWHMRCFNCKECKRGLDSMTCCDGPDLEIYCKGHYASKFGPKGIGYGIGAGVLSTM